MNYSDKHSSLYYGRKKFYSTVSCCYFEHFDETFFKIWGAISD